MNGDWQNVAVFAVVAAAALYVVRLAWLTLSRRRAAACGSCGTCPAGEKREPEVFALGDNHSPTPASRQS